MTAVLPPGRFPASGTPAATDDAYGQYTAGRAEAGDGAVIVLTYRHAGAERLWSLLTMHPDLVCTSGTGLVPLCEQAAATWRGAENRANPHLSRLAVTSIRAFATPVITTMLARQEGQRWCEFVTAPPRAAEAFLQLYPQTRVLCLHRSCADVIEAAIRASPWGLAGPEYAPFTSTHPASMAAALTAYWTVFTAQLIDFEGSHPDVCKRIRYEDLIADPYADDLFAHLGIEASRLRLTNPETPGDANPPDGRADRAPFPVDQVPATLLTQADNLATQLGYPYLGGLLSLLCRTRR